MDIRVIDNISVNSYIFFTLVRQYLFGKVASLLLVMMPIVLLYSPNAYSVGIPTQITDDATLLTKSDEPWRIFADNLVSINDGIILEARGNVLLTRGDDYLKAEYARFYTNTQWILLQGNVFAKLGKDEVKATEAEFDLTNSTGWLLDASIFMADPHLYFNGREFHKEFGDHYIVNDVRLTACDGDLPAWSLTAGKADIIGDSYAYLSDTVLNVFNVGFFYVPYFMAPTKSTRQTGLLQPDFGLSSTQGVYYTQPWFWSIDQSRDMTFYVTGMTEIGAMGTIEYRSNTTNKQKTWASIDFLYDGSPVMNDANDPVDPNDGYIRDNNARYWVRSMADGSFGDSTWMYKVNLDYVSDQNFLREFKNRMTGYDDTRDTTFKMFGRDFSEIDKNRVTEGYVYRDWERVSLYGGFRYEQNPALGNGNVSKMSDETVQHLPEIYTFLNKAKFIEGLPFEFGGSLQSSYMYREEGTSGFRAELYPQLSMPLDLRFATLEISTGLLSTFYINTIEKRNSPLIAGDQRPVQDGLHRFIPDVEVELYSQARKIWEWGSDLVALEKNLGQSQYTAMRHVIQPRASYSWVADIDQENNPFYTSDDRLQDRNNIVFSLDNLLTFRKESVVLDENGPVIETLFHELLDIELVLGYDMREANRTDLLAFLERRPWHDMELHMRVSPYPWVSLYGDAYYSIYDGKLSRVDGGARFSLAGIGAVDTSYSLRSENYDYRNIVNYDNPTDIFFTEEINVITNRVTLNFIPDFLLHYSEVTNLSDGSNFERRAGIGYIHQCFRVMVEYTKDTVEEGVNLNFEFLGLSF